MAKVLRRTNDSVASLGASLNELKSWVVAELRLARADVATISADSDIGITPTFIALGSHNDRTERTVTAPDATSLGTSIVLVNQIRAVYEFHRVDTFAHLVADTTNTIAAPLAHDLTTAYALANELKADYNLHRSQSTVHATNDSGNQVTSPDADTQNKLNTLLNEMKGDLNAHMLSGVSARSVRVVPS